MRDGVSSLLRHLREFHEARLSELSQYIGLYWLDGYTLWAAILMYLTGVMAFLDMASGRGVGLASIPFPIAVGLLVWDLVAAGIRGRRRARDQEGKK